MTKTNDGQRGGRLPAGLALLLALAWSQTSFAVQLEARAVYIEGREHLIEERHDEALRAFRRIVTEFPDSEEADDAQYYIGYALAEMGRSDEALEAFAELLDRWPDSVRVERARAQRAEILARRGGAEARTDLVREVFDGPSSWTLKRDTAYALARRGNLSASDVLEQAMERESSGRQIELARILAPMAGEPAARRILILGLSEGRSSSVKLRALDSLERVADRSDVTEAIGRVLADGSSSSVKQKAVLVLAGHLDSEPARRALANALESGSSSSVQMLACRALGGHLLDPAVRPSVVRVFQDSAPSSVRLQCLQSLQSELHDRAAAEVLRAAIESGSASSSVQLRALQLAASSREPEVRAVAEAGLAPGRSSSVQLQAVRALASGSDDEGAARALDQLFQQGDVSTSVLIAGIDALEPHMNTVSGPRALGRALSPRHATSVQLRALRLAEEHVQHEDVRRAVLAILDADGASTSVQLEAISILSSRMDDPEVRGIVSSALHPSNSTSVVLRAVESLGSRAGEADSRAALIQTLDSDYSTSVVLAAVDRLAPYQTSDPSVREALARTMEDRRLSSSARVKCGEHLAPGADDALKARIADAMEEVILRSEERRWGQHDILGDAFDVLESVDPARAEALRARERERDPRSEATPALPWRGYPGWTLSSPLAAAIL